MANNPYVNKVVYGNNTLIDLTSDTVTADKLAQGYTAHDSSGAAITGTMSGGNTTVMTTYITPSSSTGTSVSESTISREPKKFALIFADNISRSTSNRYYHVTSVVYDGNKTDGTFFYTYSGAIQKSETTKIGDTVLASSHYSWSYSGTTLTITSDASRTTEGGSFYKGKYILLCAY